MIKSQKYGTGLLTCRTQHTAVTALGVLSLKPLSSAAQTDTYTSVQQRTHARTRTISQSENTSRRSLSIVIIVVDIKVKKTENETNNAALCQRRDLADDVTALSLPLYPTPWQIKTVPPPPSVRPPPRSIALSQEQQAIILAAVFSSRAARSSFCSALCGLTRTACNH